MALKLSVMLQVRKARKRGDIRRARYYSLRARSMNIAAATTGLLALVMATAVAVVSIF